MDPRCIDNFNYVMWLVADSNILWLKAIWISFSLSPFSISPSLFCFIPNEILSICDPRFATKMAFKQIKMMSNFTYHSKVPPPMTVKWLRLVILSLPALIHISIWKLNFQICIENCRRQLERNQLAHQCPIASSYGTYI